MPFYFLEQMAFDEYLLYLLCEGLNVVIVLYCIILLLLQVSIP